MKSSEVRLGSLNFVPDTRELTDQHGNSVQLRHKSREVLHVLVENAGNTVSKSDIMASVWTDVIASDDSLVQCIADIRRLIGNEARQIVETVPREGYRLNIPTPVETGTTKTLNIMIPAAVLALAVGLIWAIIPGSQKAPPSAPVATVRATPPGTDVTEAYLEVLKGRLSADRFSKDESLIAERHFRRAIELDPKYARAHAELGALFAVRFENDWAVPNVPDREKALFYAEKAVTLDPELWMAHYALGRLQSILANLDAAEAHLEMAMSLKPDSEDARAYYGIVRNFRGDAEGAIAILEPALASHPNPPYWYYLGLGNALFNAEQYDQSAAALNQCLERASNSPYCLRYIMAVYGMLGRREDAAEASRIYRSMGFNPTVGAIMALMKFHTPEDQARMEDAFRRAGLPE